jgi:tetratricopeptide (TPR) repeat protein
VLRYADNKQDAIAVGRELKVDAVLDGTIQNEGKHLRVTLQLINVSNGNQLWSGQFDGQSDQLLALQDKISSHAVQNLPFSLSDSERKQFGKRTTDSAEAYEAYLKGRYFWHKRTEAGLKKGIEYFQNSVEHDPTYALAYAGLADSYIMMANWRFMPSAEAYEKARAAARRALELDPQLAEAKTSLAYTTLLYQWDWNGAEQAFREAIALNPNYASAHHFYSICLLTAGRQAEALAEIQRAQELDPLSLIITSVHGWIHYEG